MAKYQVTYACGHTTAKQLYGTQALRDSYIAWAGRAGSCEACRKADAVLACDVIEAEHTLPALTGSDKQIAWARSIRAGKIAAMAKEIDAARPRVDPAKAEAFEAQAECIMSGARARTAARWWIDAKDLDNRAFAAAATA